MIAETVMALLIAEDAHAGQTDKAGRPYIEHPIAVAEAVETPLQKTVALLHDVVEDCPEWPLDRLREHFLPDVVEAVEAITRRPHERADAYYSRVAANDTALAVKLADIAHNSDPARLALIPDEAIRDRLRRKYAHAIDVLTRRETA